MSERKELNGDASPFVGDVMVTKLKQKTLFAFAKSYVESKTPISGPGLHYDEQYNSLAVDELTVLRIVTWSRQVQVQVLKASKQVPTLPSQYSLTSSLGSSLRAYRPALPHMRPSVKSRPSQNFQSSSVLCCRSQSHRVVVGMDSGTRICCSLRVGLKGRRLASLGCHGHSLVCTESYKYAIANEAESRTFISEGNKSRCVK